MKWVAYIAVMFVGLWACKQSPEVLLQKEVKVFESGRKDFLLPESTSGSVKMEVFIDSGFSGVLLLQNQDENVFGYKLNIHKGLYPLKNNVGQWQTVSLNWNLANSSLLVLIDGKLQTIRLVESSELKSINQFAIRSFKESIKARNILYSGSFKAVPHRLKIVAFGNSTTAYRSTITGVYSQRLPELLLKENIPNLIVNEGVPGSHTGHLSDNKRHKVQHALDRLDKNVLGYSPDITIVCFGINDSWHDDNSGVPRIPVGNYKKNLSYIITAIKNHGSEVILMTPNALGKRHEKWRYDYTEKYVNVVRDLAGEFNVPLVDQWAMFESYADSGKDIDDLLLDGTHPNDIWHTKLAQILSREIKTIFKEQK